MPVSPRTNFTNPFNRPHIALTDDARWCGICKCWDLGLIESADGSQYMHADHGVSLDKPAPVIHSEPSRKGQLCGHQISYGAFSANYCARLKAVGLYFCAEHHDWMLGLYGEIDMAPGNAVGLPRLPRRKRMALQSKLTPQGAQTGA